MAHDGGGGQVAALARALRGARHAVAFTGAGLSTSAGLPDYRGEDGVRSRKRGRSPPRVPPLSQLQPTPAHRCVAELVRRGFLRFVVTQNVDGLHSAAGLPRESLWELHGNAAEAVCDTCAAVLRPEELPGGEDWRLCPRSECPSAARPLERRRAAKTRRGNGRLRRNVVPFDGEVELGAAEAEAAAADVALVLGTSLRVQPFAGLVQGAVERNGAALAVVNRGPTTAFFDRAAARCGMRFDESCDDVLVAVTRELVGDPEWQVPPFEGPPVPDAFGTAAEEDGCMVNCLAGSG